MKKHYVGGQIACLLWAVSAAPWTEENAAWNLNFESRYEPQLGPV